MPPYTDTIIRKMLGWGKTMKRNRRHLFLQLTAVVSIIGIASCAGSSKRKEAVDEQAAIRLEISYGHLLAIEIIKKYPVLHNDRLTRYIGKIGKSVALFAGRADFEYHFAVLDNDAVNAFATPGGFVFITKGAIKNAQNEAEIAGVLAHEIAHINLKHIMKDIPPPKQEVNVMDLIAALLVAQGATVSAAMNQTVGQAAELLFKKGYQVNDEYEADRSAIGYVTETGYFPGGLLDYLERIENYKKDHQGAEVYNTHPPFAERISRVAKLVKEAANVNKPKNRERFVKETAGLK